MNANKLRLLMFVLVFIALTLGILCLALDKLPQWSGQPNSPSEETQQTSQPTQSVQPSTTAPAATTEPTQETTAETTEATTEATTMATTEATTVPETTEMVETDIGYAAAMLALEQIGKPYRYGGAGPDDFDASGLLQYCFAEQGVSVPRSTSGQADFGYLVAREELKPGDAVFFWSSNPGTPEYVGIYIGNSIVVASMNSSKPVLEFNMDTNYYKEHFVFARRFY